MATGGNTRFPDSKISIQEGIGKFGLYFYGLMESIFPFCTRQLTWSYDNAWRTRSTETVYLSLRNVIHYWRYFASVFISICWNSSLVASGENFTNAGLKTGLYKKAYFTPRCFLPFCAPLHFLYTWKLCFKWNGHNLNQKF